MSYSVSANGVAVGEVEAQLTTTFETYQKNIESNDVDLDAAAKEQFEAVKAAVKTLVDSGTLGSGKVNITISGHANPGHKPTSGWANDAVTISVGCADTYQAPA